MLHSGGPERWLIDLCSGGPAENLEMDIAVLWNRDGLFARRARELSIPVIFCEGRENPLRFISNLRKVLREHGPYDAIHSHIHTYSAFVLISAWLEGIPARVVHSHNVVSPQSSNVRQIYNWVTRSVIRLLATACLAPAQAALDNLVGFTRGKSNWRVMRCGISLEPFRAPIPENVSRSSFGIPPTAFVVGFVGRLCAEKNSEFLLDVFAEVLRRRPDAYLLMLGEGPLREVLEAKAQNGGFRDRLILAGVRTDVPAVLKATVDVFTLPSPLPPRGNEALPLVVVEAQACGLPTLISDGVTTESVIVPDLVEQLPEAAGVTAWAEALLRMGAAARPDSAERALSILEASEFNCMSNLKTLAHLYSHPGA